MTCSARKQLCHLSKCCFRFPTNYDNDNKRRAVPLASGTGNRSSIGFRHPLREHVRAEITWYSSETDVVLCAQKGISCVLGKTATQTDLQYRSLARKYADLRFFARSIGKMWILVDIRHRDKVYCPLLKYSWRE